MEVDDDSQSQNEGDAESESSETAFAQHPYARAQKRRNGNYAWMSGMPGQSLTSWEREKLELQREIHSLQKDMKKLLDPKGKRRASGAGGAGPSNPPGGGDGPGGLGGGIPQGGPPLPVPTPMFPHVLDMGTGQWTKNQNS